MCGFFGGQPAWPLALSDTLPILLGGVLRGVPLRPSPTFWILPFCPVLAKTSPHSPKCRATLPSYLIIIICNYIYLIYPFFFFDDIIVFL